MTNGIFDDRTNKISTLDTVRLSIYGARRPIAGPRLQLASKPEGLGKPGCGSVFGARQRGSLVLTGNPVTFHFGPYRKFPVQPDMTLLLQSECEPLTCGQLDDACAGVAQSGNVVIEVSCVEFACDITGILPKILFKQALSRADVHPINRFGGFRIGHKRSPWFARIYRKPEDITRVEAVLNRPFLKRSGIKAAADIGLLRNLDLSRLFQFRVIDKPCLSEALSQSSSGWQHEIAMSMSRLFPLHVFAKFLRDRGIDPIAVTRASATELLNRGMRASFVW